MTVLCFESAGRYFDLAVSFSESFSSAIATIARATREPWKKNAPLRRQPDDHHFWSFIMLAVTAGAFLLVVWVVTKALFGLSSASPIP